MRNEKEVVMIEVSYSLTPGSRPTMTRVLYLHGGFVWMCSSSAP
ncbi:MAG: hypothetical protein OJF52_003140 [Nitrospira sp.]|jgi:hypothetical protein|nr:MAG: hypothetical protein OJF52_003140 [Nitrospira sp.]